MGDQDLFDGQESHLVEFYGTECHFCKKMEPLVERLEEEEDVNVQRLEVWHDSDNAEILKEVDDGRCGGVPFFINSETGEWICGATEYEDLKAWALGENTD